MSLPWWEVHRASETGDLDGWLARELEKQTGVVVEKDVPESNANGEGNGRVARPGGWTTVDGIVTPARAAARSNASSPPRENDADAWRAVVASAESDGTKNARCCGKRCWRARRMRGERVMRARRGRRRRCNTET